MDGSGNVYISNLNNSLVLKETPSAGSYTQSIVANSATNGLYEPRQVAVDGSGNVYIADTQNGRVLKETLSAGSYTQSVVANSAANGLSYPVGVAVDGSGNVYIADDFNTANNRRQRSADVPNSCERQRPEHHNRLYPEQQRVRSLPAGRLLFFHTRITCGWRVLQFGHQL